MPLAAARAFSDHVVSGLESPLVVLCTAAFAAQALRARASGAEPPWLGLSLAASLLATSRPDALLLVLPCLAALGLQRGVRWGRLALGALPLVAWEIFSVLYYGFAFPNTSYAKLDTGIGVGALARQGLYYAEDLLRRDGASAVLLLLGLGFAAVNLRGLVSDAPRRRGGDAEPLVFAALGLGIAVQIAFVVTVGGDFMSGRFFAPSVFLAALLVAHALRAGFGRRRRWRRSRSRSRSPAPPHVRPTRSPPGTGSPMSDAPSRALPRSCASRVSATARPSAIPGFATERARGSGRGRAASRS